MLIVRINVLSLSGPDKIFRYFATLKMITDIDGKAYEVSTLLRWCKDELDGK